MDPRNSCRWLTACLLALAAGCSRPTVDGVPVSSSAAPPEAVIAEFLEAVRQGNDRKSADLLTPLARQRTAEWELVVAPPGSETARFRVGDVQLTGEQAQVQSEWTDLDTDGLEHTDTIVWLLRREREGWRVLGMVSKVFADRDALVLNFEEPQDMLQRQQLAEEELARRERQDDGPSAGVSDAIEQRR